MSRAAGPSGWAARSGASTIRITASASPAPGPGRFDHGAVEPAARLEDAGRVDQHQLRIAPHGDAAHRHARRLHLVADDGDLGAHERIDQGGLARIRRADHGDEAGTGLAGSRRAFIPPPIPAAPASRAPQPVRLRAWSRLRPISGASSSDAHLHGEMRRVVRPLRGARRDRPARARLPLRPCAHSCKAVLAIAHVAAEPGKGVLPIALDELARRLHAAIEIERGDHRFDGAAQNGAFEPPAAARFAGRQDQMRRDARGLAPPRRRPRAAPAR